jgi:hypothetical protein
MVIIMSVFTSSSCHALSFLQLLWIKLKLPWESSVMVLSSLASPVVFPELHFNFVLRGKTVKPHFLEPRRLNVAKANGVYLMKFGSKTKWQYTDSSILNDKSTR